jgi:hypothetical protein
MMLGGPFFSDFDDDYQYFQPHPSYYEQQRRAALRAQQEEARRRAELEHYFRMKAMEEERLRQQQEYERQLLQKAVMEERRRREQLLQAEKEEARRKKLLREREAREEAERRDRMRALRFLSGDAMDENTDDDQSGSESEESSMGYHEEPIYELMRGPDGRVYRVPVGVKRIPRPVSQKFHQSKKENRSSFHSSMENGLKKTDVETNMKTSNEVPTNPLENLMSHSTLLEQQGESKQTTKKTKKGKKNRNGKKKRIQVIVEDASDSETEDEFYKSPWRNRRPSPGAWIEPVEFFDRMP